MVLTVLKGDKYSSLCIGIHQFWLYQQFHRHENGSDTGVCVTMRQHNIISSLDVKITSIIFPKQCKDRRDYGDARPGRTHVSYHEAAAVTCFCCL